MKRAICLVLVLSLFLVAGLHAAGSPKKILMVVSNVTQIPGTELETGVWGEELVVPYNLLTDAGYNVDIASATGGPVIFDKVSYDPKMVQDRELLGAVLAFMVQHKEKMAATIPLKNVVADDYEGIFVPGGHGVMFDVATDADLARLTEAFLRSGKVVSSVCHGPCFLATAKDASGKYLIDGYKVTGFCNAEEAAVNMAEHMPFSLEDQLQKASGGRFEAGAPWSVHVVADRNLITGQNPGSSKATAEKFLQWLKTHKVSGDLAKQLEVYYEKRGLQNETYGVDYGSVVFAVVKVQTDEAPWVKVRTGCSDVDACSDWYEELRLNRATGEVQELKVNKKFDF